MPKFIPKEDKKKEEQEKKKQPEKEEGPQPSDEELAKLRELEQKFGELAEGGEEKKEQKKEEKKPAPKEKERKDEGRKKVLEHEAIRHVRPPEGAVAKGDPDYISKETAEKRKRELSMTEARLRTLEREEHDINKRLEYLRKEHSAMELAIKEKSHLEREIAELREDRDRIKDKYQELKELEEELETKTWEELKESPSIGPRISSLERRIHELEGQILDLKERLRARGEEVAEPASQEAKEKPKPEPSKPEPKQEKKEGKGKEKGKKKKPPDEGKKKKSKITF